MKIECTDPEIVDVPRRLRSLRQDKVDQLAESMAALGLQQPITVWSEAGDHLELVAGAHRLAAAIKLGWESIDCIWANGMPEIDRQLWEIDENLMRAELNPTELGEHITRRAELWGKRETQVSEVRPPEKSVGNKSPPTQKKGFAADTAKATGMSKRTINEHLARTKAIPADVRDMIKGTRLDTRVYLDSLKGMEPDDQRAKVKADLAAPKKPNRSFGIGGVEGEFQNLQWRWNQVSCEAQRRFKNWVSKQVPSVYDDGDGDA